MKMYDLDKLEQYLKDIKELCSNNNIINDDVLSDLIENSDINIKMLTIIKAYLKGSSEFKRLIDYDKDLSKLLDYFALYNNIDLYEEEYNNENICSIDSLGMYMNEIPTKVLSPAEELELFKRYESGDLSVFNKIVESNLRLVIYVARRYKGFGLEMLDLINEGNIGLMKAVKKYDYHKGCKFSTYATYWIRQNILREAANQGRIIRLPIHLYTDCLSFAKKKRALESELGKDSTKDELMQRFSVSKDIVDNYKIYLQDAKVGFDLRQDEDGENHSMEELLCNDEEISVENKVINKIECDNIKELIKDLNPKEQEVIKCRFGFYDNEIITLEEVSKRINIKSREGARQIEAKALSKLRRNYYKQRR